MLSPLVWLHLVSMNALSSVSVSPAAGAGVLVLARVVLTCLVVVRRTFVLAALLSNPPFLVAFVERENSSKCSLGDLLAFFGGSHVKCFILTPLLYP